jgi:hypothetical protein
LRFSLFVQIHIHKGHNGHSPGSDEDIIFLPLHPMAIHCCVENLHNLNDVSSAISASQSRATLLYDMAEPYERVSYRFFPTSKEVGNLAYALQKENGISNDDWFNVNENAKEWIANDMVIFHQHYDPTNNDSHKRPFVLVIQTPWMRELAKKITPNSAWALDSTFKTNQYGLPLYAAMCPNFQGIGMPIFLMLCSADKGSGQEGVALELTIKAVFDRLGDVRPNAIVIDKSNTEYNALMKVIEHDKFCWMKNDNHIIQTHCHLLLCWFHAKKHGLKISFQNWLNPENLLYIPLCAVLWSHVLKNNSIKGMKSSKKLMPMMKWYWLMLKKDGQGVVNGAKCGHCTIECLNIDL